MKTWDEYQAWVGTKCRTPVECSVMKLCGEAGEVAELYGKHLYHGLTLDKQKLKLELGDVLWYLTDLARRNGIPLSEVADANVRKIEARYPTGFSIEAAQLAESLKGPAERGVVLPPETA